MAETLENRDLEAEERELRGKLLGRLLIAGGMVAGLLGILAFFDYLSSPDEAPEPPVFSKPVPVPPKKEVSQPVKETTDLPAPPVTEVGGETAEKTEKAEPADKQPLPPDSEAAPAKPDVRAQPSAAPGKSAPAPAVTPTRATPAASSRPAAVLSGPVAPATSPAVVRPVSPESAGLPSARVLPPSPAVSAPKVAQGVPEGTAAPGMKIPDEAAVAAAPAARPAPALVPLPQSAALSPLPFRALSGYVVQAGVFSTAKAAEELHAKLTLNGIPSTLEARVQIGPFKNREEAEAAQRKLKALGIEGLMIPPAGVRR